MKKMVIDLHCDSALKLLKNNNINNIDNQFTLKNALRYDKYIQFFAMYIEPEFVIKGEYDLCLKLIDSVKNVARKNSKFINIITNKKELERYMKQNCFKKTLGILLTVEDGICLEGKIDNLIKLYNKGIRVIGLTWNGKNQIASGVGCLNEKEDGLTKFGTQVVRKMNELGIIIDVSHISEKSFYDVMKVTTKPVIASHCCAKSICNHPRNLTDDQIKLISKRKGIIGVNFYKEFLNENIEKANVKCVVDHIRHIYNLGGKYCISIGSDYDGMDKDKIATYLENNSKLLNLTNELKKANFSDEDIDRIMWKNSFEFLQKNLK